MRQAESLDQLARRVLLESMRPALKAAIDDALELRQPRKHPHQGSRADWGPNGARRRWRAEGWPDIPAGSRLPRIRGRHAGHNWRVARHRRQPEACTGRSRPRQALAGTGFGVRCSRGFEGQTNPPSPHRIAGWTGASRNDGRGKFSRAAEDGRCVIGTPLLQTRDEGRTMFLIPFLDAYSQSASRLRDLTYSRPASESHLSPVSVANGCRTAYFYAVSIGGPLSVGCLQLVVRR